MDGLHEMTGSGVTFTLGESTYQLRPLRAKDWGEAARQLLTLKKPALEVLKNMPPKGLPDEAIRHLVELAYQDERAGELVPGYEIDRWFRRGDGAVFEFWLMIRQAHPEINLERAEQIYDLAKADEHARQILAIQAMLNEGHVLGNLPSPAKRPGTTASENPSHGEPSSSG